MFIDIPKNITDPKIGKAFFDEIKQFKEKGKGGFGGKTISFKGDKTTLESLYGSEPVKPTELSKKIWDYIKENKLTVEPKAETNGKNGKKTVKVNNVADMEKAVEKIKSKKGK